MNTPFPMMLKILLGVALLACCGSESAKSELPAIAAAPAKATIIVQNYYYALPGKQDAVYRWRLHASEVRAKLGLLRGRVLRPAPDQKSAAGPHDFPDVIWECDYPSLEAREADVARLSNSKEFDAVEKHMQTLIRDFRRVIFEGSN